MLGYYNLALYYKTVFSLAQFHGYSIFDLENMMPFERDLYVQMLITHLEERKRLEDNG